jgi:hypothetical protein
MTSCLSWDVGPVVLLEMPTIRIRQGEAGDRGADAEEAGHPGAEQAYAAEWRWVPVANPPVLEDLPKAGRARARSEATSSEGEYLLPSMAFTVCRVTPIRSASSCCVIPPRADLRARMSLLMRGAPLPIAYAPRR